MAAVPRVSTRSPRTLSAAGRTVLLFGIEAIVFLTFFVGYFFLRGLPPDRVALATGNALDIIRFERALGVFHEASWQRAAAGNDWLIDAANFTYMNLHLPLLAVMGFLFFRTDLRKYRVLRNGVLISAFVGVPFYLFYPVTPPRLLLSAGHDFGFVDTLDGMRGSKPGAMTNWYAAIPSYHFGWISLMIVGVWWCWRAWVPRVLAVAFGAWMWWAIVVTANHYFIDMVLGAAIVMACLGASYQWERWTERHPRIIRRYFVTIQEMRLPF